MGALKYSRQRESIKELLRTRGDHPTADMVYESMRQIYPNISLGTVYRNLSLLVSIGEMWKWKTWTICLKEQEENFLVSLTAIRYILQVCAGNVSFPRNPVDKNRLIW